MPGELQDYCNLRNSYSEYQGFILVDDRRIVLPTEARGEILGSLDSSH